MLHIFNVITGSMLVLDMDLALQKVEKLKEALQRETETPVDKQVLLVSGGVPLQNHQLVGQYFAGADTNPIFFFSLIFIDSDIIPRLSLEHPHDTEVKDQIEESKRLPANQNTVMSRAQLAQKVYEYSRDQMIFCERLSHNQHLQQQGWAAAVANLEDILVGIHKQYFNFEKSFKEHMLLRDRRLHLIDNFPEDLKLLEKIPLLPALSRSSCCNIGVISDHLLPSDELCSSLQRERLLSATNNLSLLDWIMPNGFRDMEEPLEDYKSRLLDLNNCLLTGFSTRYISILNDSAKPEFREIGGLEDRLSGLDALLRDGSSFVVDQKNFADSFQHNQTRSVSIRDESIYPNLCKSQVANLEQMLNKYEKIRNIRKRCLMAKNELSHNIMWRSKWLWFVEQKVNDLATHLHIWNENMRKIENQLSMFEQLHTCPKLYFNSVAEVIRRQNFNHNFAGWAHQLSTQSRDIWDKEVSIRESFMKEISTHFLKALFPGLDDIPPAFAAEAPEIFDIDLPNLSQENILLLKEAVPEICSEVSFNEHEGIPQILLETALTMKQKTVDQNFSSEDKNTASTELFASAIGSTIARQPIANGAKTDPSVSPDHIIISRPTSLIRDHPESETDTEEFEKVCGSISDGTYSPMEPERNISISKMRSRSSQENNPSPLCDRLQSPPLQLLQEFVTVQCRVPEEGGEPVSDMFEVLTHNDFIDALQLEALRLKSDNISQNDLAVVASRLLLIISKFGEVKRESASHTTIKELQDQIELQINQLSDAQREVEIYQHEIQRLQANIQQTRIDFEEKKQSLIMEHEDAIKKISLEHELENETLQNQWQKETGSRAEELVLTKNKLSDIEKALQITEQENNSLAAKISELESLYSEKEKETVSKERRKLLEENMIDKQRQEEIFNSNLERSLSELKATLEREFSQRILKERQELEEEYKEDLRKSRELCEAQTEEEINLKLNEQKNRLIAERDIEMENARLQYKMELEGLRSRFRMMTMDRSPSETSLEKVERGDFVDLTQHESTIKKLREELKREKEVALDDLKKSLDEIHRATLKEEIQKCEEKFKKMVALKQEEFNSAVNVVTQDKERVIENLRLKVEFLSEEKEKLQKHSSPTKSSEEIVPQPSQISCETHKKEIDRLEKELHRLKRLSFISERHADVSLSFSESGSAQVAASSVSDPSTSSSACGVLDGSKVQQENAELKQALLRLNSDRPPKISIYSCQPDDFVLIVWDEHYSHYRILLEGHSALHFVHSESYELLGLNREKPSKLFCLAEVVRKEFCQAKKDENRFKVPKGTKFYRVTCMPPRPLYPFTEGEKTESRQRKTSVMGVPPTLQPLQLPLAVPSIPSESDGVNPSDTSTEGAVGFSLPVNLTPELLNAGEAAASSLEPTLESTSASGPLRVSPEKKHRDSRHEST